MKLRTLLITCGTLLFAAAAQAEAPIENLMAKPGYNLWLSEDHALPLVTIKLSFPQSGSAYDPPGKEGLSSFLTQMLDEGAGDMDALAFHQALEKLAIRFSAEAGEDMITVTVQTLSENKEKAVELMLLALTRPRFDAEAVERIRASILSDIAQMQEEPSYIASRSWKERAFPNHPYSRLRRGSSDTVTALTADDLRAFLKNHLFAGKPPIMSVVGDVTPEEVRGWNLPALHEAPPVPAIADVTLPDGTTPHIILHEVPQAVAMISLPAVKREDPEYYALQILEHVLGGSSITSRLGSEIRNKRGLTYHVGTDIELMDHAAFLSANFATRNASAKESLEVFNNVLKDMAEKGITEQELNDAKHYLIGSFPLQHDTQNELAGFLIGIQYYRLGMDYPQKRNQLIEKVTLQEVNSLAKKLLAHTPLVVMVGKPEGLVPAN